MLPALSQIQISSPVDPYPQNNPPTVCNDVNAKPGVIKFSKFIRQHQGGTSGGIVRQCGVKGAVSYHNEGRGWDWMVDADKPEDQQKVAEVIAWLFAPGPTGAVHEMLRRSGIFRIIWDRKMWSASSQAWKPFTKAGNKTIEHRDHVHFSFSKAGANEQTSLYPWIDNNQPVSPPGIGPFPIIPMSARSLLTTQTMIPVVFGLVVGLATVAAIYKRS